MGIGSIVLKQGLKYARTGVKYASVIPHYAFGKGYSTIQNARKAVGGKTIFQNFGKKSSVGWQTLKQDLAQTANKPGLLSKALKTFKAGVSNAGANASLLKKAAAGTKNIAKTIGTKVANSYKSGAAAASTGKYLSKLGKTGKILGGLKSVTKPLRGMPVVASLVTLGYETYANIYPAFKEGGFWAGMKEAGKSCVKIAAGAALGAVGAAVGGFVGGLAGYAIGEQIADKLMGGSYSDTHAAETKEGEQDELSEAQANGVMPEDPDTQTLREQLRLQQEAKDALDEQMIKDNESAEQEQSKLEAQATSELPEKLEASNTATQNQLVSNPYTSNGYNTYSNPFGFDAGTNIFQRFPMGYTFQYQGNGMGMMI